MTESRSGFHIGNAGSSAASGANSRRRPTPPHLPLLIHHKAKENHGVVLGALLVGNENYGLSEE
ncbi:hypothetical protein E5676_scaffold388G00560 [Cucumis melo var. makuwa]|uniref:Uncharacterized protein n=2 Tax=Cucumis melo TaxID=3656 RepID=A0A5D3BSN7_CUCMM|nr:hypothetical protein E6C27_scaffold133G001590 [Cucumis melo var. makuwa]TYK02164.1 hypothetical protein E5676_scaffold388G00560 [Cucumis melo var. makuwa]